MFLDDKYRNLEDFCQTKKPLGAYIVDQENLLFTRLDTYSLI
jgi:hypothetical protein